MELNGKNIAILAADDYEDIELLYLYYRMQEAGANVKIIGTELSASTLRGKHGYTVAVDMRSSEVKTEMLNALIIPGGWAPDRLSWCNATLNLIKKAFEEGKYIATISKGLWVLVSMGILQGKTVTSDPAIRNNIRNAGANWIDESVISDGNLITARMSSELPALCQEIIKSLT